MSTTSLRRSFRKGLLKEVLEENDGFHLGGDRKQKGWGGEEEE